jgi:hypothetical protein
MTAGTQISAYPPGSVPGWTYIDVLDRFGPNSYALITQTNTGRRVSITTDITAASVVWTQLGSAPSDVCGIRATGPAATPTFYALAGACQGFTPDRLFRFSGTASTGTWQQVTPPVTGGGVGFGILGVDRGNPNRLFVSVVTPTGARVFRSTNGGTNWTADTVLDGMMTAGGTYRARVRRGPVDFTAFTSYVQPSLLSFDPNDANTMIAGSRDAGLFLTRDGGATWSKVTDNSGSSNNPVVPRPNFVYYDRECGQSTAFVATQGRGIWKVKYATGPPAENENCPQ